MRLERPATYYPDGVTEVPCTLVIEVTPQHVVDAVAWGQHDAQEVVPATAVLVEARLADGTLLTPEQFCEDAASRDELVRELVRLL